MDIEGILAIALSLGIPIVAILASHQQKMAQIFQENARLMAPIASGETDALREEIRELKSLVHEQAITLDNLVRPIPVGSRLEERVAGR